MTIYASKKHIARWTAVSIVLSKTSAGLPLSSAISSVAEIVFPQDKETGVLQFSRRSLYRWVARYKKEGFDGLKNISRVSEKASRVLDEKILDFIKSAKIKDEHASIPDIIRSMEIIGLIKKGSLCRTSVWRATKKMRLPIFSGKSKTDSVKLRFSYAHRTQMVLCDGKHFRVGIKNRKRMGFFFIDDATRKVLGVVIGKSENKCLFLRGVMKVIKRYGLMNSIYTDNGAGFIAKDVAIVLGRIGINLIHGTAGYPEGRGKIERFNRTLKQDLLRTFLGDPTIESDVKSLEMRCQHYTEEVYNIHPHSSLENQSPDDRWSNDSLELNIPNDIDSLAQKFIVTQERKVKNDNTMSVDGIIYEVPFGYAGRRILIMQDLLHSAISIVHQGKNVILHKVDSISNSKILRLGKKKTKKNKFNAGLKTAARYAYERDFESILTNDGDFFESPKNNKLKE